MEVNDKVQPIGFSVPGWKEPPHPGPNTLVGNYCRLEALNANAHGESLYKANSIDSEGRNWTYLPYGPFREFEEYIAWVDEVSMKTDPLFYAIVDADRNEAGGVASYLRIKPSFGSIEVGHINYSPLLQRTRAATEAMYLMMKHAFKLGYRRYEWKCDALNSPSRAAAQRYGFSFEGIFRQALVYKGRNRDTAWYSIIDREWPELERAFLKWLDASNFDEAGKQITSLSSLTLSALVSRA